MGIHWDHAAEINISNVSPLSPREQQREAVHFSAEDAGRQVCVGGSVFLPNEAVGSVYEYPACGRLCRAALKELLRGQVFGCYQEGLIIPRESI